MIYMVPFCRSNILLPKTDFEKWSVIACDQFTSEGEYWLETEETVGDKPSSLSLILPEIYLSSDNSARIKSINESMIKYLHSDIFKEYTGCYVYVERTQPDGKIRRGIVGEADLDSYDYHKGAKCDIRASEETVISRIPPRVEIRKDASLELPHIMLLYDDINSKLISSIDKDKLNKVYDFTLMQGGGKIAGWLICGEYADKIDGVLSRLYEDNQHTGKPFLAVGDGNHSLATAFECYKKYGGTNKALCEIVNIHEEAIEFEPIFRLVTGVDISLVKEKIKEFYGEIKTGTRVDYIASNESGSFFVDGLAPAELQKLTDYLSEKGGEVDYIHGEDSLKKLASKKKSIGFIFPGIDKSELFEMINRYGSLPRKTFSIGEARSKRYYLEARIIK